MANRERGEVTLAAHDRGGACRRMYTLRLTVGTCCELEDRTGRDLDAIVAGVNAHSIRDVRWLLWAGLQGYHAEEFPTPERAGTLMDDVGGVDATVTTLAAFMAANADPDPPRVRKVAKAPPRVNWRQLYIDARAAGVSDERFWLLSLREVFLELGVGRKQFQRDRALAWLTALCTRTKKLPDFEQWLGIHRPQTVDEMKASLAMLREMYPNSRHKRPGSGSRPTASQPPRTKGRHRINRSVPTKRRAQRHV